MKTPLLGFLLLLFLLSRTEAVRAQTDSSAEKEALTKAEDLYERLRKGSDFSSLAIEYSDDRASGKRGGELGWAARGVLVPAFEEVAFSLTPGQIAQPVRSEYGYHLIQLLEKRQDSVRTRHILIRIQP